MAHREHAHQGLMIVEQSVGTAVVLSAAGTIDMLTAPQLQQHVDAVLERRPAALIIDLIRVEFMGSAGIGVLVDVHNQAASMPYALVADGPATSRPLRLLAIDKVLDIYPRLGEALEALGIDRD